MQEANSKNFIHLLTNEKPIMIFFHYKDETKEVDKIKSVLNELEKDFPLLPSYEYVIDANEDNKILAEHLEVDKTPVLTFYKNGSFNRYKDKLFTKKAIALFIGSKKLYGKPQTTEDSEEIESIEKKKSPVKKTATKKTANKK